MDRELKRGTLEMVLLQLLSERPKYGYELVTAFEERSGGRFRVKDGTLYPVLYRLEKAGLVQPEWQTQERGVPRKYYRVTEAGAAKLAELITDWRTFVEAVESLITENN